MGSGAASHKKSALTFIGAADRRRSVAAATRDITS